MNSFFAATGRGVTAAIPLMIGYVPVALTFGMAGLGAGLTPLQTIMISAFVFAGASQFLLVASLHTGASWWGLIVMCALLNARHMLYGAVLRERLGKLGRSRLAIAFGLTDEVFATALSQIDRQTSRRPVWLGALGLCAWMSWMSGTLLGVALGSGLAAYPFFTQVLAFASPALFTALIAQSAQAEFRFAMGCAAVVALALLLTGQTGLAILGGALAGGVLFLIKQRQI